MSYTGNIGCNCECHKSSYTHKKLEPLIWREMKQFDTDEKIEKLVTKINEMMMHFTQ